MNYTDLVLLKFTLGSLLLIIGFFLMSIFLLGKRRRNL